MTLANTSLRIASMSTCFWMALRTRVGDHVLHLRRVHQRPHACRLPNAARRGSANPSTPTAAVWPAAPPVRRTTAVIERRRDGAVPEAASRERAAPDDPASRAGAPAWWFSSRRCHRGGSRRLGRHTEDVKVRDRPVAQGTCQVGSARSAYPKSATAVPRDLAAEVTRPPPRVRAEAVRDDTLSRTASEMTATVSWPRRGGSPARSARSDPGQAAEPIHPHERPVDRGVGRGCCTTDAPRSRPTPRAGTRPRLRHRTERRPAMPGAMQRVRLVMDRRQRSRPM